MQEATVLAAIDVGTTKVCAIIAVKTGAKEFRVLAHCVQPCDGLKKGNVVDIAATGKAIRAAIDDVEQQAGVSVQSAYVGITGAHVSFENRWDGLEWAAERGVITPNDLSRVPQKVASAGAGPGRKILHAIPIAYSLDGKSGIRNPLGMHTRRVEVETHVVTGAPSLIKKLVEAVESSGIEVAGLVLEPLASSEAVLTPKEKQEGAAVVDIGGGTTDVVVFRNGSMCYTSVIPVAGYQFTNDICQTYNTPYPAAEAAKLRYANADLHAVRMREEISLPVLDRVIELKVPHRDLCQLARERAQELVRLIKLKLEDAQVGDLSNFKIVLTGGTSNLPGFMALVQRTLTNHVRIGVPDGNRNIPEELRDPMYATGVGILLWGMKQRDELETRAADGVNAGAGNGLESVFSRFFRQVGNLVPAFRLLHR